MGNTKNIKGLHHVAIRALDFEKTLKFYTEGLDYVVSHTWSLPEFKITRACMLKSADGSSYIEVFDYQAAVPCEGEMARGSENVTTGSLLHFALNVQDAAAAFHQAIAAGASACVPPSTLYLGTPAIKVVNALVYSPNGEVIEFLEPNDL